MATFDYAGLLVDVKALVQEFGRQVTLVRYDRTPANAAEPWEGATEPRNGDLATVWAVSVPPSSLNELGIDTTLDDNVSGLTRASEILICEPGEDDPDALDTYHEVRDGDDTFAIVYASKLKPADTTMLYFLGVKR